MILIPTKVGDLYRITYKTKTYYLTKVSLENISAKSPTETYLETYLASMSEYVIEGNTLVKCRSIETLQKLIEERISAKPLDPVREYFDANPPFVDKTPFQYPYKREIWCATSTPGLGKNFL